jgi:hypothetical protein
MLGTSTALFILLNAAFLAAQDEPPAPAVPANPAPVSAPPQAAQLAPPVIAGPTASSGFLRRDQPVYGPLYPPSPAQNLAMLEAGGPVFPNDPRVRSAAVLLTQLTGNYVEDAGRISELTIHVVRELHAARQAASPLEVLVGATQWKRPAGTRPCGSVPREFEEFAARYRKLRLEGSHDHATTLSLMQGPAPVPSEAPTP